MSDDKSFRLEFCTKKLRIKKKKTEKLCAIGTKLKYSQIQTKPNKFQTEREKKKKEKD